MEGGNRIFNLEMQTTHQKDLPKRSRYYGSMIDLNTIEKGESYRKLKESYVIFICTFDPFQKGMPQYTFENLCVENKELKLDDKTRKIFFNTTAYEKVEDEDVRAFLKYVNGESDSNPLVQKLETRVGEIRANKEWRQEYMTLLMREEEIREESIQEGIKVGIQKGIQEGEQKGKREGIQGAVRILKTMNVGREDIKFSIIQNFQLSEEEAETYLADGQ